MDRRLVLASSTLPPERWTARPRPNSAGDAGRSAGDGGAVRRIAANAAGFKDATADPTATLHTLVDGSLCVLTPLSLRVFGEADFHPCVFRQRREIDKHVVPASDRAGAPRIAFAEGAALGVRPRSRPPRGHRRPAAAFTPTALSAPAAATAGAGVSPRSDRGRTSIAGGAVVAVPAHFGSLSPSHRVSRPTGTAGRVVRALRLLPELEIAANPADSDPSGGPGHGAEARFVTALPVAALRSVSDPELSLAAADADGNCACVDIAVDAPWMHVTRNTAAMGGHDKRYANLRDHHRLPPPGESQQRLALRFWFAEPSEAEAFAHRLREAAVTLGLHRRRFGLPNLFGTKKVASAATPGPALNNNYHDHSTQNAPQFHPARTAADTAADEWEAAIQIMNASRRPSSQGSGPL